MRPEDILGLVVPVTFFFLITERLFPRRQYPPIPFWNLMLWDMLMGTFKNPKTFDGDVGFAGQAPQRVGAMLLFQDVNPN